MVSYRERFDIIADMLYVAGRNPKKTQIMYQANLSYSVLQRYLSEILAASLVSFDDHGQNYVITTKGQEFLYAYKEFFNARKNVRKHLGEVAAKRKVLEQLCCDSQINLK